MVQIRKADNSDRKDIFELVKSVLDGYGLKTNPKTTDRDISDLDRFYFKNRGWFAVIEDESRIVGSYGLYRIDESTCELRKMYLLPMYQGKGLGRSMMEDGINKAKEMGFTEMILETNRVLDKAIGLYKKYGFIEYESSHLSTRCDLAMRMPLGNKGID